jgi:hypothetical protein
MIYPEAYLYAHLRASEEYITKTVGLVRLT